MCHGTSDAVIRQQEETPISRPVKANDPAVRGKEVRLVGPDNQQFGIVPVDDAIAKAEEASMDLVLVADRATPPVCRIMNFGKHQYEQSEKPKQECPDLVVGNLNPPPHQVEQKSRQKQSCTPN